jgi:hypothetical protein
MTDGERKRESLRNPPAGTNQRVVAFLAIAVEVPQAHHADSVFSSLNNRRAESWECGPSQIG